MIPLDLSIDRRRRAAASRRFLPSAVVLGLLLLVGAAASAEPRKTSYSTVDLIVEQASIPADGGTLTVGFDLVPDAGWHGYWLNPGDAGKEASIRWSLPDGFVAGPLRFPAPQLVPFGEFNTYAFDGPVLLLADLAVPPGLASEQPVALRGTAVWVVCDDELCVPEQAEIAATLPVGDGAPDAANAERFRAARAALPTDVDWPGRYAVVEGRVEFEVELPPTEAVESPYLFVAAKRLVTYAEQSFLRAANVMRFSMAAAAGAQASGPVSALLRLGDSRAVRIAFAPMAGPLPALAAASADSAAGRSTPSLGGLGLVTALVFGLLGGVILNLMPCVFPVLSIKALGLVNLAGADRRTARESGLLYTAGILVAIGVGASVLFALRAAGSAYGWGFQLQSPLFNVGLGLVMVAIGLNLAGVFEVGTRLMGVGDSLAGRGSERRSAFFTGLLAVVVATPCSAPFMASALGFALTQPVVVALAVFFALGLGLALPYLVLSFVPNLGARLPRPGPWMAVVRTVLAFPMLATALWLFWVVGRQLGATAMAVAVLAALLLAFALWSYGQGAQRRTRGARGGPLLAWRAAAVVGLVGCAVVALRVDGPTATATATATIANGSAATASLGRLPASRFTPELVRARIAERTPTFVYFTADWCITCKVNEQALKTDVVADFFNQRGVEVVVGDWTNQDPAITEWLVRYGRAGVPLYLYFPAGASMDTATVLPQVLLPGVVVDAVVAADARAS